ncbi:hypothetical protein QAD02_019926 [Eretmocerus hayati]|uniref:Uncharacterized protein n=1 Tax=Eretmocerus hayati TaxID=131215 RepID=A0ACC2PLG1_9HYME|nr:hypothetical protein QAD02_019926 [Eretmocerus hayati]
MMDENLAIDTVINETDSVMCYDDVPVDEGMRKELKSNYETYKYCFVPDCTSTTRTAPHKVFVTVPRDLLKRQRWCDAVESPGKKAKKSRYCCEDHFDLLWSLRLAGGSPGKQIYGIKFCLGQHSYYRHI